EPIEGIEVMIIKKEAIATAISFGFPIQVTRSDKDFYALLVANSYLGEHRTFNGILMQRMRGARGLNYGDYSYIENFIQDGGSTFPVPNIPRRQQFFSVWIRPVAHANAHFALRQAIREIQLMVDNGISQEDFEETRDFLINYSKLWVQTPGRRLGYLMDSKFYGIENYIDRIEKELSQLTVEQVNEAIRKYLQYDNIKVAIVTRDAETLKENLIADKISPIVYQTPGTPQHILEEDKEIKVYPLNINAEKSFVVSSQELFEE
ncbi:MAG: M16 family metallopeptidase, partial [Fidelibacterota bacterium]